jgi:HAD superfamily hydrolase (TIGR01509 family)
VRAVLFDWRGTLVHDPAPSWWIERAFITMGRSPPRQVITDLAERIDVASRSPEFLAAGATIDCDPVGHRATTLKMFRSAGMDTELAEALYGLDFDPECHPIYPDVAEVLRNLHDTGCRIAIVSDSHFDLRPEFDHLGLGSVIDEYVLSFEHGVQKPDPRIFEIALRRLCVEADEALMVGDRPSHDGGGVAAGITTLLLPTLTELQPRGLDLVLTLADLSR